VIATNTYVHTSLSDQRYDYKLVATKEGCENVEVTGFGSPGVVPASCVTDAWTGAILNFETIKPPTWTDSHPFLVLRHACAASAEFAGTSEEVTIGTVRLNKWPNANSHYILNFVSAERGYGFAGPTVGGGFSESYAFAGTGVCLLYPSGHVAPAGLITNIYRDETGQLMWWDGIDYSFINTGVSGSPYASLHGTLTGGRCGRFPFEGCVIDGQSGFDQGLTRPFRGISVQVSINSSGVDWGFNEVDIKPFGLSSFDSYVNVQTLFGGVTHLDRVFTKLLRQSWFDPNHLSDVIGGKSLNQTYTVKLLMEAPDRFGFSQYKPAMQFTVGPSSGLISP
jgi:hypothetical protein